MDGTSALHGVCTARHMDHDVAIRGSSLPELDPRFARTSGINRNSCTERAEPRLGTSLLVFPDMDEGRALGSALLAEYERWGARL